MAFKILIIDDSPIVRQVVKDVIERIKGAVVCGEAKNGQDGINKMIVERPQLAIMDVEMPVMDGITALREIRERGIDVNVLMLSGLTREGATTTFQALELGALDFVPKPSFESGLTMQEVEHLLQTKIEELVNTSRDSIHRFVPEAKLAQKKVAAPVPGRKFTRGDRDILVIGCSTGGPRALQKIFEELSGDFPLPILIVQHMPPLFTAAFAERLNALSPVQIKEAATGDTLKSGHAYLAPGNQHMMVKKTGVGHEIILNGSERVNGHRPSVDVTLESIHEIFHERVIALIMTGMGNDGVAGMGQLHNRGALTLAQDEDSSVVFGMNRRAIEAGSVDKVVKLKEIASTLMDLC